MQIYLLICTHFSYLFSSLLCSSLCTYSLSEATLEWTGLGLTGKTSICAALLARYTQTLLIICSLVLHNNFIFIRRAPEELNNKSNDIQRYLNNIQHY